MKVPVLSVEIAGRRWQVAARGHDLSIPLAFDAPQPAFFGTAPARAETVGAAGFIGDVRRGGSCNCSTHTLTPHCNGTHTECVGHVTADRVSVQAIPMAAWYPALLVTLTPVPATATAERSEPPPQPGDRLITRSALAAAAGLHEPAHYSALIVRTLPNSPAKQHCNYDTGAAPPYFSAEAMHWIVGQGVEALVVDLPSLDRASDQGRLAAHRIFWGLPAGATALGQARRPHATVTELAYIDDSILDGPYLLNLQVAPFVADAAPSRPILLPLVPA